MKVFLFDLLAYGKHFEEYKADRFMPYPLSGRHFDAETAARTYEEHLLAWEEMDRLGFDGVGLNEHHTTPHGLMCSPNMMAAVGAQRTKNLKFLILGELLPLHNPLRIAEEIAMADCMSKGRVWPGFARGVPREYKVYDVPMSESRARFEESFDIIMKAWTEDVFSHQGKFWSFKDMAIWPRTYQQPYPKLWVPFSGSKETIQWAARHNINAVIPDNTPGFLEDVIGYYGRCLAEHGHRITPDHICLFTDAYVADSKAQAIDEYSPYFLYFNQTLWHHGSLTQEAIKESEAKPAASVPTTPPPSLDYVRPENLGAAVLDRAKIRNVTQSQINERVGSGELNWGSPKEITERLIESAEQAGTNTILLNVNVGAMPYELFLEQIRRFGRDVLPKLQAHEITSVPAARERA